MTPDQFIPVAPGDLLGTAGQIAAVQIHKAMRLDAVLRLLLHGEPGCGKTAACRIIANAIAKPHDISHCSAADLTAEQVRDWSMESHLIRGNEWRVYHIDECDAMNPTVGLLMLKFAEDLAPRTALLCTSNLGMGELSHRFQSRFQTFHVGKPAVSAVAIWLTRQWPALGSERAVEIARATNGDVRAALNDAQAWLDFEAAKGASKS